MSKSIDEQIKEARLDEITKVLNYTISVKYDKTKTYDYLDSRYWELKELRGKDE